MKLLLNEKEILNYLDYAITSWRGRVHMAKIIADIDAQELAAHYVDAFQSVRKSLFGKLLL